MIKMGKSIRHKWFQKKNTSPTALLNCARMGRVTILTGRASSESQPVMRKPFFAYAKTKTQISFAVTAKLISAFVFAI